LVTPDNEPRLREQLQAIRPGNDQEETQQGKTAETRHEASSLVSNRLRGVRKTALDKAHKSTEISRTRIKTA
jgi:hypothetical protein